MEKLYKVHAIVTRSAAYGDNDKMLTVLSEESGLMSVCAKGVKSLKNKNSPSANPLCYSEMVLKEVGDGFLLVSADIIESFYNLREDVTALSAGVYFAQLAAMCVGAGVPAKEEMKLLLNTLFILAKYPKRYRVLKAVFELRLCEAVGVAPIIGRCECGGKAEFFDVEDGESVCALHKKPSSVKISPPALRVMDYVLDSTLKEALLFDAPEEISDEICNAVEKFMLFQFGQLPKSLDYLKKVSM